MTTAATAIPDGMIPLTLVTALVIAMITTLTGVIAYLFKHFVTERKTAASERGRLIEEMAKERQEWAVDRVRLEMQGRELRIEFETKHRELIERHADALRQLYEDAREHETLARREYAANMEVVAEKAREAQDKVGTVLDKLYNRYVGGRRSH